jgi:hypothetical protein
MAHTRTVLQICLCVYTIENDRPRCCKGKICTRRCAINSCKMSSSAFLTTSLRMAMPAMISWIRLRNYRPARGRRHTVHEGEPVPHSNSPKGRQRVQLFASSECDSLPGMVHRCEVSVAGRAVAGCCTRTRRRPSRLPWPAAGRGWHPRRPL